MSKQGYAKGIKATKEVLGMKPKISPRRQAILDYLYGIGETDHEINKVMSECERSKEDLDCWLDLAIKWKNQQQTREEEVLKKE
jgi:hypothetical protein